jgi:uncharacterized membrane protein YedE/YeeE
MKTLATAFISGALFAGGLGIAGMTRPAKVIGFLDVTGNWDPSLAFVMLGAIGVYAACYRVALRRGAPVLAPQFRLPTRRDIDARLIGGAATFGFGWGIAGFCPGPAVTALASGHAAPATFVVAMLAAMAAQARMMARLEKPASRHQGGSE